MRFMLLMYPGAIAETQKQPKAEDIAAMTKYNDDLRKAGVLLALDGLQPSEKGARVRFPTGEKPIVADGPFTESKEIVGGYWMIQVKSREEAIEWVKRCPCNHADGFIEVRQVFEMADFTNVPPDVRAEAEAIGKAIGHPHA